MLNQFSVTVSGFHFRLEEAAIVMVTILLSFLVLHSRHTILNRRARKDMRQAQRSHSLATPRLGGAVIFGSVVFSTLFVEGFYGGRYAKFALSMLPMISVTLWEDMVRPTSPRLRLWGTLTSCIFTLISLQIWFMRGDVPLLDPWMAGAAGMVLTLLFVTSSVNAFNMVDGVNGLCTAIAAGALLALSFIANAAGYAFMQHITMSLAVATGAFLLFNFPKGRIFLGDTGSFLFGYIIAWFGVSVCYWFPAVSPWAIVLILAYPLSELVLTVSRRLLSGRSPFSPDALHIHHLVLRLLGKATHGKFVEWQNPLTALLILPFAIAPMVVAAMYFDSPRILQAVTLSYGLALACVYGVLLMLTRAPRPVERVQEQP